jgi:hemerythrin
LASYGWTPTEFGTRVRTIPVLVTGSTSQQTMLLWSEKFETGHTLIDTQHKMLVSYINRLEGMSHNTNPNRQEVEFFVQLVGFMETYIDVHFKQEEECMNRYKCPAHQENKEAHRQFLVIFRKFKRHFEADGIRPAVLLELHEAGSAWIQQHILQIDMRLKPCLNRIPDPDQPE